MAALSFRPFESADLQAVHTLNEAAVPAVGSVSTAQMAGLNEMATQFLLAHYELDLAGFLILMSPGSSYTSINYQWFSERYSQFLYVDRIVIDPSFHRRGIATAFYAKAWSDAQRLSTPLTCEVNVVPPNPESMAFHSRLGFREVGRQKNDGEQMVSMLVREQ